MNWNNECCNDTGLPLVSVPDPKPTPAKILFSILEVIYTPDEVWGQELSEKCRKGVQYIGTLCRTLLTFFLDSNCIMPVMMIFGSVNTFSK